MTEKKTEKKKNEGKRLKYRITGSIEISATNPLELAMTQLKTLTEEAKKLGDSEVSVSVPRLTNVKL